MKNYLYISVLLAVLSACSTDNGRSDAYGNFETKEIIISAQANGEIVNLQLEEGELLSENKNVGLIDTIPLSLKLEQLKAQKNTVSTKTQNVFAKIEVQKEKKRKLELEKERVEKLLKDEAATAKQLDDIVSSINIVDKQIKIIQTQNSTILNELKIYSSQMEQLKDQISKCNIISPINGTVLEKYSEQSEFITMGRPVFKIADLSQMILRVYVSGKQLPNVKIGQEVEVLIDGEGEKLDKLIGTVSWIASRAEFTPKIIQTKEERVNLVYAVKIRVENDGRLKIGMPGEVNFSTK